MGLPEQARGTAQPTVTGIVGPTAVPKPSPDATSQQSAPSVQTSTVDEPAKATERTADSLETFLAKFEQMAKYLKLTNIDRFYHLCASLEGAAGQVLWGLKSDATTDTVIALLRTHFGNELQVERFRAELRARKRQRGESLQSLYLDTYGVASASAPHFCTRPNRPCG